MAYDELDVAVVRATQGDLPVVSEPYAPAAAQLGSAQEALLEHLARDAGARLLRRVAAILFHRRAGFSANGMGVWQVPRGAHRRGRSAHGRLPRHPPLLPAPDLSRLALRLFTMAHGRSKEECDAILDAIADEIDGIEDRATLYARRSSRRSGCSTSPTTSSGGSRSTPESDARLHPRHPLG